MGVENSRIAWKRNSFYGLIKRYHTELNHLKSYPLTPQEKARLMLSIGFIQDILTDRNKSIELFGKENNFKKYQNGSKKI